MPVNLRSSPPRLFSATIFVFFVVLPDPESLAQPDRTPRVLVQRAPAGPDVAETPNSEKPAWEWTDEERLAVRFDPNSVRERASREATEPYGASLPVLTKQSRRPGEAESTPNIIIGRRNPELFMPFELFSSLIGHGFSGRDEQQQFRTSIAPVIVRAGLDPDRFWQSIEVASQTYIANVLGERALAGQLHNAATDSERAAILQQMTIAQKPQCRQRADSLDAAARELGRTALYRVLYEAIAPNMIVSSAQRDDSGRFRHVARGCR